MGSVHVATLNIRNLADRWDERLPLLLADMAALQPDVLGLQEVVYPLQQDRLIGAGGEGRYESTRGWAGRPEYGNALLVRRPFEATDPDRLDLGLQRSAGAYRRFAASPPDEVCYARRSESGAPHWGLTAASRLRPQTKFAMRAEVNPARRTGGLPPLRGFAPRPPRTCTGASSAGSPGRCRAGACSAPSRASARTRSGAAWRGSSRPSRTNATDRGTRGVSSMSVSEQGVEPREHRLGRSRRRCSAHYPRHHGMVSRAEVTASRWCRIASSSVLNAPLWKNCGWTATLRSGEVRNA